MKTKLTIREIEILQLIMKEYTTTEIASKLHLSSEIIKTHRRHLMGKLQARNVAGLVRRAYESGQAYCQPETKLPLSMQT